MKYQILFSKVNIAQNKPAWQLNQHQAGSATSDASNAVDGLKSNLGYGAGQCAMSDGGKQTAIWRVDLEDILSIHHIIIYYRTENKNWGKQLYNSLFIPKTIFLLQAYSVKRINVQIKILGNGLTVTNVKQQEILTFNTRQ
jgi:hypothetical protein